MFHHLKNKSFLIILLIGFGSVLVMLSFLITGDLKIPQKETVLQINIKNQVNICLPEDDFNDEYL